MGFNPVKRRAEKWMSKNKKTDIKFDIRLFDNRMYSVKFNMTVPADIITKLAEWMLKRQGVKEKVNLREFEVDERLHGKVLKGFKKAIDDVERQVKKDIQSFKFITFTVEKFKYTAIDNKKYDVKMLLKGDYAIVSDF
jgi:hypothetical protein